MNYPSPKSEKKVNIAIMNSELVEAAFVTVKYNIQYDGLKSVRLFQIFHMVRCKYNCKFLF